MLSNLRHIESFCKFAIGRYFLLQISFFFTFGDFIAMYTFGSDARTIMMRRSKDVYGGDSITNKYKTVSNIALNAHTQETDIGI